MCIGDIMSDKKETKKFLLEVDKEKFIAFKTKITSKDKTIRETLIELIDKYLKEK